MQIDPYNAIYAKLTADQTAGSLYADVSGRIRLDEGEQDMALPCLLYTPVTDVPDVFFGTLDDLEFVFQTDLYFNAKTSKPEDALATNQKLIALLHKQVVAVTNHANGQVWCTDKGAIVKDSDAWRVTSQWKLTASET